MPSALFQRVTLQTTMLDEQKAFYVRDLDFPLIEESSDAFTIQIGSSRLEFRVTETPDRPLYHFAIDVPENQLEEALTWTSARTKVEAKADSNESIHFFEAWNAHAFYWLDAERNIAEFITRHTAGTTGDSAFSTTRLVGITELAVVTQDVRGTSRVLMDKLGLACYPDPTEDPGEQFQAIGDHHGLFIVVKGGRNWLSDDRPAAAFPSRVEIRNAPSFELTDTGCIIQPSSE
jgi:catechol-2,3-dioxygenase